MRVVDEHWLTAAAGADDVRLALSAAELEAAVGPAAVRKLFKFFGRQPSGIRLRRVQAGGGGGGNVVAFHTDFSLRTMQVPLNDDYCGGQLVKDTAT